MRSLINMFTPDYDEQIGSFVSLVASDKGVIEWASNKFLQVVGKKKDEIIGKDFAEVSSLLFNEDIPQADEMKAKISNVFPAKTTAVIENAAMKVRIKLSSFKILGHQKNAAVFLNR